ncbi:ABC transporter ATP-binding protein [Actinoplanes sp. NPDC048791]|uniref:ABC transporter ATP-binding protein n=1 Tax=Actinoplanes sp. NPDC048791 TaxID=3154623 RepID=UPI0033CE96D8
MTNPPAATVVAGLDHEAYLRLDDVSVTYSGGMALAATTLSVAEGQFVSIVGTSGCGKSTLLNAVAGLIRPTTGRIRLDGRRVTGPGRERGMVFQQYSLFPWLTAAQNVAFGIGDAARSRAERRHQARDLLHEVGLDRHGDAYPDELSGGMQQRVAIARMIASRPKMMLMDEPLGALDALTRRSMQGLLERVWRRQLTTALLVTHDIAEAVLLSDRVIVMADRPGRVVLDLTVGLPRPRDHRVGESELYRGLVRQVYERIYDGPAAAADL